MSRDHYLLLRDVTVGTENKASSIIACWTVFTELFETLNIASFVDNI
jgi:hypothetical protein